MISKQTVRNASCIVCIRALHYDLPVDLHIRTNHPDSRVRIQTAFEHKFANPELHEIMSHVLQNNAINRVWAIVLENDGKPLFVIRNAIYKNTKLPFRRILRVDCGAIEYNMIPALDYYFMLMNLIAILSILVANFCIAISFLR